MGHLIGLQLIQMGMLIVLLHILVVVVEEEVAVVVLVPLIYNKFSFEDYQYEDGIYHTILKGIV